MAERPAAQPSVLLTRYWLPVLVYVSIILILSAQQNVQLPIQFHNADKFYHLLEYLGLGLLLARAWRASLPGRLPFHSARVTIVTGVLVGVGDELFQSWVPTRMPSIYDLLADATGLLLAQIVYLLVVRE